MLRVSELAINIKRRPILQDISFSLEAGETLAIMGPSGCGKTTLMRSIAGFVNPFSRGDICYNGILWQDAKKQYLSARQRCATLLFQELAVWPHLSVKRQLDLVNSKDASDDLISELALTHRTNTLGRDLSGGEKQRLALGRALKTRPNILLLDEPFTSLDAHTKSEMIHLVRHFKAKFNFSLILVTHDLQEAGSLYSKVFQLK